MIARALAALLLCLPGAVRAGERSGHLRMALIEDNPTQITFFLAQSLERLSKDNSSKLHITDVKMLPCYYSDGNYRFSVPPDIASSSPTVLAAVLNTESGKAFVYPPNPDLIIALRRVTQDPQTYGHPWSVRFTTETTILSQTPAFTGAVLTAALNAGQARSTIWHQTAAYFYALTWQGKPVSIITVGERFGGLGRQAYVLSQESKKGRLIGVARGEVFGGFLSEVHDETLAAALEKMGLRYSGVGLAELRDWDALMHYRHDHPNGIKFISANVVYSSATQSTVFPDHVIINQDGLRVAIAAITPVSAARELSANNLANMQILDPVKALYLRVPLWRKEADVVVLLADMSEESAALADEIDGVDLILAKDRYAPDHAEPPPEASVTQKGRRPFDPPLTVIDSYDTSVDFIDADVDVKDGISNWSVRARHDILDDTVPSEPGYPEYNPEAYGISFSTYQTLIPPARDIFNDQPEFCLSDRQFWTMAASLVSAETHSELAVIWVWPLSLRVEGSSPITENVAKSWLPSNSALISLELKGSEIKPLLATAKAEDDEDAQGLPLNEKIQLAVGGLDDTGGIDGRSLNDDELYRVTMSRTLADALGFTQNRKIHPVNDALDQVVLDALEARAGSTPALYRAWAQGRAAANNGLWLINFRDVSLNFQNTQVVNNGPFGQVPDSRIQSFSQQVLGGDFKADANYFQGVYKWSNTLEMQYAKSRLEPPGSSPISNTSANSIDAYTTLTRKIGDLSEAWLAKSWGPSAGFEYQGQFVPPPGLPQQNIFSLYPGVQFYGGTWLSLLEASGIVLSDQSRTPPNTQYGLHTRTLLSHSWGNVKLQGEFYANYSFLTATDEAQDLRLQGDANLKLSVPITRYLNLAPFIDVYFFGLKVAPEWGYSAMTGVSLQFSTLWKPQYQPL